MVAHEGGVKVDGVRHDGGAEHGGGHEQGVGAFQARNETVRHVTPVGRSGEETADEADRDDDEQTDDQSLEGPLAAALLDGQEEQ